VGLAYDFTIPKAHKEILLNSLPNGKNRITKFKSILEILGAADFAAPLFTLHKSGCCLRVKSLTEGWYRCTNVLSAGRLFQTLGPDTGKARQPIVESSNGDTTRRL